MQNTHLISNINLMSENNDQNNLKVEEKFCNNNKANILEQNSTNNFNNEDTNVENLLKLIKDQTNELKKNKKRLEKLEEAFKKTSSDLKLAFADRISLENFLKIIFPKDMHEMVIKLDYGSYNSSDLSKFWLVCESKNQNEFQKILNQLKNENVDFTEKLKNLQYELEIKNKELKSVKNSYEKLRCEYDEKNEKFNETFSKYDIIESEKHFLMNLMEEKNKEIESLRYLEVENAELKAKSLLQNIDSGIFVKNNGISINTINNKNNINEALINDNKESIINKENGNNKNRLGEFSYNIKNKNILKISKFNIKFFNLQIFSYLL